MGNLDALVGSLITSLAVILYYPSPWNFGLYSMIYVVVASSSCSSWRTIMIYISVSVSVSD